MPLDGLSLIELANRVYVSLVLAFSLGELLYNEFERQLTAIENRHTFLFLTLM